MRCPRTPSPFPALPDPLDGQFWGAQTARGTKLLHTASAVQVAGLCGQCLVGVSLIGIGFIMHICAIG